MSQLRLMRQSPGKPGNQASRQARQADNRGNTQETREPTTRTDPGTLGFLTFNLIVKEVLFTGFWLTMRLLKVRPQLPRAAGRHSVWLSNQSNG